MTMHCQHLARTAKGGRARRGGADLLGVIKMEEASLVQVRQEREREEERENS